MMRHVRSYKPRRGCGHIAIGILLAALAALAALAFVSSASAAFEQVSTFNPEFTSGLSNQIEDVAVNVAGEGGIDPGTLVVGTNHGVVEFTPEGHLIAENLERGSVQAVAVDRSTGLVYAVSNVGSQGTVAVYSPDLSEVIAVFAPEAPFGETVDESPEMVHSPRRIAVDASGTVYLADLAIGSGRVMVWKPETPGDYSHYVYTGQEHDIGAYSGGSEQFGLEWLSVGSEGDLYGSNSEAIYEFAPADPDHPMCRFQTAVGGIEGMTAFGPGEVLYFTPKAVKGVARAVHQLRCVSGSFEEVEHGSIPLSPPPGHSRPEELRAMAVDPMVEVKDYALGAVYAVDLKEGGSGYVLAAKALPEPPKIDTSWIASPTTDHATLFAQINPEGPPTHFEYLSAARAALNPPGEPFAGAIMVPGTLLGLTKKEEEEKVPRTATATAVALLPGTEYFFRAVASSQCHGLGAEPCVAEGATQPFRTFTEEAPGPSDHRAYELVSPPQKAGGEVIPAAGERSTCPRECKPSSHGFPIQTSPDGEGIVYSGQPFSGAGAVGPNEYLSRRGAAGWTTTTLSSSQQFGHYASVDRTLSRAVLEQGTQAALSPEAPVGYPNVYSQAILDPNSLTPLITEPSAGSPILTFAAGSSDLSRLDFESSEPLPTASFVEPPSASGNNLYEWSGGALRLVNVLPGNTEAASGAAFGAGATLSSGAGELQTSNFSHVVSDDGSRVFWSKIEKVGVGQFEYEVFVREDGDVTKPIPGPPAAGFLTASADGSHVLLTDGELYDLETEQTTDLTENEGGFLGITGQSESLSSIYFVDERALPDAEPGTDGGEPTQGSPNIYLHRGDGNTFVATLSGDPKSEDRKDWSQSVVERAAEASSDGRWLAFGSVEPLTEQVKAEPCDEPSCAELFLYEAASGRLNCVSCNPTGARPLGSSRLPTVFNAPGALRQMRYLTNRGRIYFDSGDSLSQFDSDHGAEDVYEWEPSNVGTCTEDPGCVSLISGGTGGGDSNFLAVDEEGENVFFTTRDRLTSRDHDELIDAYDAREFGGIAAESELPGPACQGEGCQSAQAPVVEAVPGSLGFPGTEGVHHKKKHHKKKHHKKKHHKKKHHKKKSAHRRAKDRSNGAAR